MMALAERSNEDSSSKIQSVMEDLRRVENEVRIFFPLLCLLHLISSHLTLMPL